MGNLVFPFGDQPHSRQDFILHKDSAFLQKGIAGSFLEFLITAFDSMCMADRMSDEYSEHIISVDDLTDPDAVCRKLWNRQAAEWAMIESPANYGITIDTYAKYIRFNPSKKKETMVSLGAGPGLYEAFMRMLFSQPTSSRDLKIYCVDYAQAMTRWNKEMLKRLQIAGVEPVTGDMMALTFPDQSIDQVLCNNALQWVSDWKKALDEMVRIIKHDGMRRLYLVINLHPMVVRDSEENVIITLGDFTLDQILDELEARNCDINNIRNMLDRQGVGQKGGMLQRTFIEAELQPQGCKRRWRDFAGTPEIKGIHLS
ncbi:MAG: class I SAM-dependent methyltransferase [Patescibacteria group bacterium]